MVGDVYRVKVVISHLKRLATWLWQGMHLASGPLVAFVPPLFVACLWPTELAFRSVGFALQVLGAWIVWIGIRGAREQFEVPGTWAETKAWWSSRPRLRGRAFTASASAGGYAIVGASAEVTVWSGTPDGATIEQRVDAIERNLVRVRDDLSLYRRKAKEQARTHEEELKRERAERQATDQAIHDKIKDTETGGLKLNAAGAWWLLSGTVCSTFPQELADGGAFARCWLIGT